MNATESLRAAILAAERDLSARAGEARATARRGKELQERATALRATQDLYAKASAVLASYAETSQADVQEKIESLVTHGLTAIFGDGMTLSITSSTRGKQTATDLTIRSTANGQTIETDIMSARGGGVAATADLLLRLTILLLTPNATRLLVLDETFAQLSEEYEPALASLLRTLSDRTGTQILMVTHSKEYSEVGDRVYRFRNVDGKTQVSEETTR